MNFDHYKLNWKRSDKPKRKNDVSGPEPMKVDPKWMAKAKESHNKILEKRVGIKQS